MDRDSGVRDPPQRANQTSIAALPQEITEPANARRYSSSSSTPPPALKRSRAAEMIWAVQWSQASSSDLLSCGLAWPRLYSSASGATVIGSASSTRAARADSRKGSPTGRSRNC
ncbi:hypothetical protein BJQ90_01762 [Arthrobacter sp. SO3]|nr:hypothetical protein [Arthrobacter sp. SO3]